MKWALKKSYPTIGSSFDAVLHSPDRLRRAGFEGLVVVVLDSTLVFDPGRQEMMAKLGPVIKQHQQWRFIVIESSLLGAGVMDVLSISEDGPPMVLVLTDHRRYRMTGVESVQDAQAVGSFLARVKSRQEPPLFRSEATPDAQMDGDLWVLTGDSFEEQVFDEARDVLVAFHAPSCEECQTTVFPMVQQLATEANKAGWNGVRFAKLDMSKNDCREEVTHLPKVVLYPAVPQASKMELRKVLPAHAHGNFTRARAFLLLNARSLKGLKKHEL